MFILDSLLVGGIRFVLDKVAAVADQELNDPERQRERLLEAQLKLENGEIDEQAFAAIEADVFERIREIKARTSPEGEIVHRGRRHRSGRVVTEASWVLGSWFMVHGSRWRRDTLARLFSKRTQHQEP